MSDPHRPFGVPPDDDDLHQEARTDAVTDADALDAWLNETAAHSGFPGTRSGNGHNRPNAQGNDAASEIETAALFHRRIDAAQARNARAAGPDPRLWETIMERTSPSPSGGQVTTGVPSAARPNAPIAQIGPGATGRRRAHRRQHVWNTLANIGLAAALLLALVGVWRLSGSPGLPGDSDEAPTAPGFAMQASTPPPLDATPDTTPVSTEQQAEVPPVQNQEPITDCDFRADIPIFNGIDESPWAGTAVLLTTSGEVVLTCPEEPEGTVLTTTSAHNSVSPLQWPGAVLIPSYGEKPEEARTRVLSLVTGEVVEFGFPTENVTLGTQGDPGSPWLVGPAPNDVSDVQILDLRTMQTRLLSEIAGAPLPEFGRYLTSGNGDGGTLVLGLQAAPTMEGNGTLITDNGLPGDLLVLDGSLDAATWIPVPDDFPPVAGLDVAPDGMHVALHGAEGQMSREREDTYSLVRLNDGVETERSSTITDAPEIGEGVWVQRGKAYAYASGNQLMLLPLLSDMPEQPVFEADGPLSQLRVTTDDAIVVVRQTGPEEIATMTAMGQPPQLYAVHTGTREATMFSGLDISDNVGWETPPDRFLVMFDYAANPSEAITYRVVDAVTGETVGTLDDVPVYDPNGTGYPHLGPYSVAESPDGNTEIIAFDSQHTYLMQVRDGEYRIEHIPPPEGILAETPMMLSMYFSPDGTKVSMSGESDESGTVYLLDVTADTLAWQPVTNREAGWLPFVPGTGTQPEPAPVTGFDFSEVPDGTEFTDGDQLAEAVRGAEDKFAWPGGYDPDIERIIEGIPSDNSRHQAGGEYTILGGYNRCAWYQTWLDAHESGDAATAADALYVMAEVIPYFPNLSPSPEPYLLEAAAAASEGDPDIVQQMVTVGCQGLYWEDGG